MVSMASNETLSIPEDRRRLWTLYEYETTSGFALTDRERRGLARFTTASSEGGPPLVEAARGEVRAAQHVGVIRLSGGRVVQILPKIHRGMGTSASPAQNAREATANLLHLLQQAGHLPIRDGEITSLLRRHEPHWFDTLSRLYETRLRDAWAAGAPRQYERNEDDDSPALRGTWRLVAQSRRPERRHRFAVSFDEFTVDAPLGRVLRYVAEILAGLTDDYELRARLLVLSDRLKADGVGQCTGPDMARAEAVAARGQITRLNSGRFTPLLDLAGLFLQGASLQIAAAPLGSPSHDTLSTWSLTFDMNVLFESFVYQLLTRNSQICLPESLAECEILPQSRGAQLYLAHRADSADPLVAESVHRVFKLKPDITIRDSRSGGVSRFPLLIDTKYKKLSPGDRKLGVSPDDLYQMYAYAHRYDCRHILLLYPQTADMPDPVRARFLLDNGERSVSIAALDLTLPLGSASARRAMAESMRDVLQYAYTIGPGIKE